MKLYLGNCMKVMPKKLETDSIGAIVTDPPYGLEFMGSDWDKNFDQRISSEEVRNPNRNNKDEGVRLYLGTGLSQYKAGIDYQKWTTKWGLQAFRVLKPGGLMAVLGHTRTYHRMACGIEDAGFEVVDMLEWVYASGFPKAYDISKGFDKKAGVKRKVIKERYKGTHKGGSTYQWSKMDNETGYCPITAPSPKLAKKWNGWKNAKGLKPAHEPILLAQKPIKKGYSIIENVEEFGVGGINAEACRIPFNSKKDKNSTLAMKSFPKVKFSGKVYQKSETPTKLYDNTKGGRFAPNLLVMDDILNDGKIKKSKGHFPKEVKQAKQFRNNQIQEEKYLTDSGSFSRYFDLDAWFKSKFLKLNLKTYPFLIVPKPSKTEKEKGLKNFESKNMRYQNGRSKSLECFEIEGCGRKTKTKTRNIHPTVKPIKLTSYLISLICPRDQIVLDPFLGSGTTLVSAKNLDYNGIGIEKNREYFEIAKARLKATKIFKRLW